MTKTAALNSFFSSFEISAFPTQAPADTAFPYLVYEPNVGAINDGPIPITVNLWYYGSEEAAINAKVQEISAKIGLGGLYVPCDGGAILIQRGTPFAQAQTDQASEYIKGRYIQLTAEYLTEN